MMVLRVACFHHIVMSEVFMIFVKRNMVSVTNEMPGASGRKILSMSWGEGGFR